MPEFIFSALVFNLMKIIHVELPYEGSIVVMLEMIGKDLYHN